MEKLRDSSNSAEKVRSASRGMATEIGIDSWCEKQCHKSDLIAEWFEWMEK